MLNGRPLAAVLTVERTSFSARDNRRERSPGNRWRAMPEMHYSMPEENGLHHIKTKLLQLPQADASAVLTAQMLLDELPDDAARQAVSNEAAARRAMPAEKAPQTKFLRRNGDARLLHSAANGSKRKPMPYSPRHCISPPILFYSSSRWQRFGSARSLISGRRTDG